MTDNFSNLEFFEVFPFYMLLKSLQGTVLADHMTGGLILINKKVVSLDDVFMVNCLEDSILLLQSSSQLDLFIANKFDSICISSC